MTYRDPHPGERPVGVTARQAQWSSAIIAGLVLVMGAIFYGIANHSEHKTANPPAVIAFPGPAAGVAPAAPQTTTGQPVPPIESTGRGGSSSQGAR
jgi:hypothetical protein